MDDLGGPSPPHNVHLEGANGYCFAPQIKSVCANKLLVFPTSHTVIPLIWRPVLAQGSRTEP